MSTLRTKEGEKKYLDAIENGILDDGCPLCKKEPIKTFKLWSLVQNDFPYRRIAEIHHMLIPLRHCTEIELNNEELEELRYIKHSYLHEEYELFIEETYKNQSIPGHFHIHLIIVKEL